MIKYRGDRIAFGKPGIAPRWTPGDKDGVGTAYSPAGYIWFTLRSGIITEIYCPTIDKAQVSSVKYLITDGKSFFHDEENLVSETQRLSEHALGYQISNFDPDGRYGLIKEIITNTRLPCVLQHTRLRGNEDLLNDLHLYIFASPHLEMGGWGNNAYVVEVAGRNLLVAEKKGAWLAMSATVPFGHLSCGYAGRSDGLKELADSYRLDWEFDRAMDGNITLIGELSLGDQRDFTLGIALGNSLHAAVTTLFQSLAVPFEEHMKQYMDQWEAYCRTIFPLEKTSHDNGNLYHSSYSLILGHEDKTYQGAFIAALSIPWGEAKGDDDFGGYHLVWTRDMVQTTLGMLAAGNSDIPQRALIYLAASQQPDGGFPQNFWLDGTPYWQGVQLDEVSFPIILAWRLQNNAAAQNFDIYPMVKRAAGYLIQNGPATQQERWEEVSGYSPSTLAINIAALICAADLIRQRGDESAARYLEEYADFLECHIEAWTVTDQGSLLPEVPRHYIRIHPVSVNDNCPDEDPNRGLLVIPNLPDGQKHQFLAKDIVDAGFLELVRYGIRRPGDELIENSLRVVDAVLKVETPFGPCWHRYNHDGFGQREDGGAYQGWGKGRAWPLLVGERAHYELAAGRDVSGLVHSLELFASRTGLIAEQVWDSKDIPEHHLYLGRPTSAAMPLVWAHAEYIKLLRSIHDGKVFDLVPVVAARYLSSSLKSHPREIWKHRRQPRSILAGCPLRVQASSSFRLHWTLDEWQSINDTPSNPTSLGIEFVDIDIPSAQSGTIKFTFYWTRASRWEGRDYEVKIT